MTKSATLVEEPETHDPNSVESRQSLQIIWSSHRKPAGHRWLYLLVVPIVAMSAVGMRQLLEKRTTQLKNSPVPISHVTGHAIYAWSGFHRVAPEGIF